MRLFILLLVAVSVCSAQDMAETGVVSSGGGASHLARSFNGTSDFLNSASSMTLGSTTVLSVSFWLYWNANASNDLLALESSTNYNSNSGAFVIDPNGSSGGGFVSNVKVGSAYLQCHSNQPTAAAWHHVLIVWDITTTTNTCHQYIDGTDTGATVTSSGNSGTFTNQTLYVMSRAGTSLFGAGRISDITIWNTALTSGNATSLAACGNPESISNGNILYHWPIKQVSPETPGATGGAVNLTVTGTTNVASGC
jgi:hypothetical protein